MPLHVPIEVLAQPIVPGVPNIPYVQQGSFVQISNVSNYDTDVNLVYVTQPALYASNPDNTIILTANYIDGDGNVTQIPAETFVKSGFGTVTITPHTTYLFGVQYVPNPDPNSAPTLAGSTPQDGMGSRGYIILNIDTANTLVFPTIRQVFTNYNTDGSILDVSEAAYAAPVVNID